MLFLLLLAWAAGAWAEETIPPDYEPVARCERWTLYLRRELMAIIVQDNGSGEFLSSAVLTPGEEKNNARWTGFFQSGVVMEYIDGVNPSMQQLDLLNAEHTLTYEMLDDGFIAHVCFTEPDIGFDVRVTLDEEGLHVLVPQDSIREGREEYRIGTLSVFSFLGHSYLGQDGGYMLIPDGQGAIIPLKDNLKRYSSPYEIAVYGGKPGVDVNTSYNWFKEPEQILMPVFGMVHEKQRMAFLGVIEEGDSAAVIRAYPNGVLTGYDWIDAKFTYRMVYAQPTINDADQSATASTIMMRTPRARRFDIRLHYYLASGEEANYTGLARLYKRYLTRQGAFDKAEGADSFRMRLDFVGAETENDIFGRRPVKMTTFAQTKDVLEELLAQDVNQLAVTLCGWQDGGRTGGLPLTGYAPHGALGGSDGLAELVDLSREEGFELMLEADYLQLNLDTHPGMKYQSLKRIDGDRLKFPTYKKVFEQMNRLTPSAALEYARLASEGMADAGFAAVALTGVTSLVTDYMDDKTYLDGGDMMAAYRTLCRESGTAMKLHLANANAYLWGEAACLYDMPIMDSSYLFNLRSVPFLAIALSGDMPYFAEYINFQANTRRYMLQLLEQGALPAFLLTWEDTILLSDTNLNSLYSAQYALYADMIVSWYRELKDAYAAFYGAEIVSHEIVGDMTRVRWSNGATVYLNWGDTAGTLDGVTIEAISYVVVTE